MSEEGNLEVVVPTNQPLICKETENEEAEYERFPDDKRLDTRDEGKRTESEGNDTTSSEAAAGRSKPVLTTTSSLIAGRNDKVNPPECTLAKSQSEIQVCVTNSLSVSQTSKNSLMTFSSSGTFYDHSTCKKKVDLRITPKRVQHSNGKDATDFRQMEQGLLQLLEDFHSGKLEAFGQGCTFERMENVREQQERLARLHFDLNAQQELCGLHTEEGIKMAKNNLSKLTENLQELSHSIEQLQSCSLASQAEK